MASGKENVASLSTSVTAEYAYPINGNNVQRNLSSAPIRTRKIEFTCFQCQKHFTESRSLARHLRESCKYNKSSRGRYRCDWCDSSFGRNNSLHRHVQQVHLLQGNKKRMSKIGREASRVLYGEPSEGVTDESGIENIRTDETIFGGLSIQVDQATRSNTPLEHIEPPVISVSAETRRKPNVDIQTVQSHVECPFNVLKSSSLKLLAVTISDVGLPARIVWPSASAPDTDNDFVALGDDMANRIYQQNDTYGFDIEDWINLVFLDEQNEHSEG